MSTLAQLVGLRYVFERDNGIKMDFELTGIEQLSDLGHLLS